MGKVGSYHHRKNEVGNDFLLPLLPTAALAATHLAVRTGFAGEASTTTNGDEAPNSLPPLSSFTLPLLSSVREIGKGQLGLQDMGRDGKGHPPDKEEGKPRGQDLVTQKVQGSTPRK